MEFLLDGQDQFIAETADKKIMELGQRINLWQITPIGTQGFRLAEVTKGGVDVHRVSSNDGIKKSKASTLSERSWT